MRTLELNLPSGKTAKIREQNGDDEIILTTQSYIDDKTCYNRFIAAITLSIDDTPAKLADIMNLWVNDKYYILIEARILSLGVEMVFEWDWGIEMGGIKNYSQDLLEYVRDFDSGKHFREWPNPGENSYFKYRIEPYLYQQKELKFELKSGKECSIEHLNGYGEEMLLNAAKNETYNKHSTLFARNLKLKVDEGYIQVESLSLFNSYELAEIHRIAMDFDPLFNGLMEVPNPKAPSQPIELPLLSIPSFLLIQ